MHQYFFEVSKLVKSTAREYISAKEEKLICELDG